MSNILRQFTSITLGADSTTAALIYPSGIEIPCGAIKRGRTRQRVTNPLTAFQQQPKVQLGNDFDDSGDTKTEVAVGSVTGTVGPKAPNTWVDLTTQAAGAQALKLVHEVSRSSGSGLVTSTVQTDWELERYAFHQVVEVPWRQFIANSTTQVFYPMTQWFPAEDGEMVRAVLELAGTAGNIEFELGCEITNNRSDPGTAVAIDCFSGSTAFSSDGKHFPTEYETSLSVDGKLYIRFGYFVRVSSAGNGLGAAYSRFEMVRD